MVRKSKPGLGPLLDQGPISGEAHSIYNLYYCRPGTLRGFREFGREPAVGAYINFFTARADAFRPHCNKEGIMKRIFVGILITSFSVGAAMAQSCETKAVSKDGKPLAGAAKTSFVKKCKAEACETKAVGKDGKPLSGAAKNSFMKKCEKEA